MRVKFSSTFRIRPKPEIQSALGVAADMELSGNCPLGETNFDIKVDGSSVLGGSDPRDSEGDYYVPITLSSGTHIIEVTCGESISKQKIDVP